MQFVSIDHHPINHLNTRKWKHVSQKRVGNPMNLVNRECSNWQPPHIPCDVTKVAPKLVVFDYHHTIIQCLNCALLKLISLQHFIFLKLLSFLKRKFTGKISGRIRGNWIKSNNNLESNLRKLRHYLIIILFFSF